MMSDSYGASVGPGSREPDQQAVPAVPASIPRACERCELAEAAQLNLYYQAERDREARRRAEEAFDLIAPFVAKFAAAVGHYNRTPPQYKGSIFNLEPDPGYRPALGVSVHGQVPLDGPTISDLRMLAAAYASAIEARRGETQSGSIADESAAPKAGAQPSSEPTP